MLRVKICGLTDQEGLHAAVEGGADYIGFIFCEKGVSKCFMEPEEAATLLRAETLPLPKIVGVFRNQSPQEILAVTRRVSLDYLQLHGEETPDEVVAIKQATGLPIIKVFRIAAAQDLACVPDYNDIADMFLFDTKTNGPTAGGTGQVFDWDLLRGQNFKRPWLLAGGLNIDNAAKAVARTGAKILDISSGVERKNLVNGRRQKDPNEIRAFLKLAKCL